MSRSLKEFCRPESGSARSVLLCFRFWSVAEVQNEVQNERLSNLVSAPSALLTDWSKAVTVKTHPPAPPEEGEEN